MAFTFVACTKEASIAPTPDLNGYVRVSVYDWLNAGAKTSTEYYLDLRPNSSIIHIPASIVQSYNSTALPLSPSPLFIYVPKADYDEYF